MVYNLRLIYENLNNGVLSIGKYTIVKDTPIQEYDYDKYKNDKKILSTVTKRNLDLLEKKAGTVFTKIYKADKSKGRNVLSTFILGKLNNHPDPELNGKEFIWSRQKTANAASDATMIYFDDRKISGTAFLAKLSTTVTKVGNLYKKHNSKDRTIQYSSDPEFRNLTRDDGPAYIMYYPEGNIQKELWYKDGIKTRNYKEGPAVIEYYPNGEIKDYRFIHEGKLHRPIDEGPAVEADRKNIYYIKCYYQNGVMHRLDGFAFESKMYGNEIYINGDKIGSIPADGGDFRRGRLFTE